MNRAIAQKYILYSLCIENKNNKILYPPAQVGGFLLSAKNVLLGFLGQSRIGNIVKSFQYTFACVRTRLLGIYLPPISLLFKCTVQSLCEATAHLIL